MNTNNEDNTSEEKKIIKSFLSKSHKEYRDLEKLSQIFLPISEYGKDIYHVFEKNDFDKKDIGMDKWDILRVRFLFDVIAPALIVILKIKFNKNVTNISSPEIFYQYRIEISESYDILKKMSNEHAILLIKQIPSSSFCYDAIVDSFKKGNKVEFVNIIRINKCDTTEISIFCSIYNSLLEIILALQEIWNTNTPISNEEHNAFLEHVQSFNFHNKESFELIESGKIHSESTESQYEALESTLVNVIPYLLVFIWNKLEDEENTFSTAQSDLIKSFLYNPEYTDVYNYYMDIIESEKEIIQHTLSKEAGSKTNHYPNRLPMPTDFDDEKLNILHENFYGYISSNQPLNYFLGGNQIVPNENLINWNGKWQYLKHFIKGLYGIKDGKVVNVPDDTWENVSKLFLCNGKPCALKTLKNGPALKDSETERIVRLINDIREGKIME